MLLIQRRRPLYILLLSGGVLAAVVGGWLWKSSHTHHNRSVVLLVSGDTAGWITPCGCTANQSGGLLRRGSFVTELTTSADVILADVGGAAGGTSAYQRVKFEAILRGEKAMGLMAHNLGGSEAALGADYLRRVAAEVGVTFLSANLKDSSGVLVASPIVIVERGGRRIALTGVLSRRYVSSSLQIDDPHAAVLREAANARGQYDSLIVLAYLPEDELRQLAAALPEADAVIGGPTGQSLPPVELGPTILASSTNKGKFLVRLDSRGSTRGWDGQVVEMSSKFADDDQQKTNIKSYLAELERRNFSSSETGLAPKLPAVLPREYYLAGNTSCRKCHASDCASWEGSKHARAWPTLLDRGQHVDPYCQQCHTTGYGLPGGFISANSDVQTRSVGCESCHGPSEGHAHSPKVRTPFAARDQCISCHDHENSPLFEYGQYWPRVRHGSPAGESQGNSP